MFRRKNKFLHKYSTSPAYKEKDRTVLGFPFLKIRRDGGLKLLLDVIKNNPGIRAKDASELLGNRPVSTIEKQIRELTGKV